MSALPDFVRFRPPAPQDARAELAALIASRRAGFTLPAPFYLSGAVFEQDLRLIFGRHWIFVGVEPEIAESGVFTVEI